jgi:hypothetical protein
LFYSVLASVFFKQNKNNANKSTVIPIGPAQKYEYKEHYHHNEHQYADDLSTRQACYVPRGIRYQLQNRNDKYSCYRRQVAHKEKLNFINFIIRPYTTQLVSWVNFRGQYFLNLKQGKFWAVLTDFEKLRASWVENYLKPLVIKRFTLLRIAGAYTPACVVYTTYIKKCYIL